MPEKILIVDDNEDVSYTVEKALGDDYEYLKASNGQECLEILDNHQVDLIILDLMMPIKDGWQTFFEMHKEPINNKAPVIFLTGKQEHFIEQWVHNLGCEFVQKPFDPEKLKSLVREKLS